MKVKIYPSRAHGTMPAPPSKSMGHRALISAGLSTGESVIHGIAPSEDMLATMDCLRALGAVIDYKGTTAHIKGIDTEKIEDGCVLPCRECGSTLRFFVPIALLSGKRITLTGSKKLFTRPMSVYEKICADEGIEYTLGEDSLTVCGRLRGGKYTVRGDVSSQFISGLIFALPLLGVDSTIEILPPLESRPYIDMTLEAIALFGVNVSFSDKYTVDIKGNQAYAPREYEVEGDYSNAAFFEAFNLLGGDVTLTGLRPDSLQGDKAYIEHFEALESPNATVDLSNCPDLGPVCMALAAAKHGANFIGTARLRIKESDRCACVAEELAKFGALCEIQKDSMRVLPSSLHAPTETVFGHNDHRIVMAMSVLASVYGAEIDGAEAVAKSLPDFFGRIERLNIKVENNGMVK